MDLFFKYLQYEKRYSPHTLTSYHTDLGQFAQYLQEVYQITDAAQADHTLIRSWLLTLVQNNIQPRSINRKIACLRSYYKFLFAQQRIQVNPMLRIKAPKATKKLPAFVPEEPFNTFLDSFQFEENFEGQRDRLILEFLYGTGIRLAELIGITHADVDRHARTVRVLGKGNKERMVPLNDSLISCLEVYERHRKSELGDNYSENLLVTNKARALYPKFVYRVVKKYISLLTTSEHNSPHVLRHSFATHLLNKGADLNAIKELLGHSSLAATQVYTHNSIEKLKSVFEKAHPKA